MQMNQDYDLARPLATALKVKAPYVGIPMPGHAPLTFDRKKLSACLRGVKPTNIEVIVGEQRNAEYHPESDLRYTGHKKLTFNDRWIKVEGYASEGRVRTRLVFKAIPAYFWRSWQGKAELKAWRESEMRAREKATLAPTSPAERKTAALVRKATDTLKRLLREVEKLGSPYQLRNPSVTYQNENPFDEYEAERRANLVEQYSSLRATKRTRTIIGAIAAQAKREQWSSHQLYKYLAERGYTFEKLSDMTAKERERYGAISFSDYLEHLHRFVSGTDMWHRNNIAYRGPYQRQDRKEWGGERYMRKLADIQMRRSLQNQIDSVRAILIANGAGPKPVPAAESFEVPPGMSVPFTPISAGLSTSTSIAA